MMMIEEKELRELSLLLYQLANIKLYAHHSDMICSPVFEKKKKRTINKPWSELIIKVGEIGEL